VARLGMYRSAGNPLAEFQPDLSCITHSVSKEIVGDSYCRRSKFENRYSALNLGSFGRCWLVSVGSHFIHERKIWGTGSLQHFSFSPPAQERGQRA
jgi:hypothetical protein